MRILLLLLLTGCSMPEIPDFTPTEFNDHINLKVVIDNDLSRLGNDTARYRVVGNHARFEGDCAIWVPSIDSLDDRDFRVWGKELAHCVYGDYHGNIRDIY